MDFDELVKILESILVECDLSGGDYGEEGWVDGHASSNDVAFQMAREMKARGLKVTKDS